MGLKIIDLYFYHINYLNVITFQPYTPKPLQLHAGFFINCYTINIFPENQQQSLLCKLTACEKAALQPFF